jgi:hypothetical protein
VTPTPALAPLSAPARTALLAVVGVGAATFVGGLLVDPVGAWAGLLVAALVLGGLSLAGAVLLALHYVTGARWSVGIRRVPEAMVETLPLAAAALLAVAFGARALYAWADPATVASDEILHGRAGWMNLGGVLARTVVSFAAWIALARALVRRSRRSDLDGDPAHRARNVRTSAVFLVVFAPTFSLLSFDWVMSLERHWFSTIFPMVQFAGLLVSGTAATTAIVVALRRAGVLRAAADDDVLHDLGKLLFGFTLLWGYLWFCQYLLVWYVNNPEETPYYLVRHSGAWAALSFANVALNWAIPFAILLPRAAKRREGPLLLACGLVLAGRWLDLTLHVAPAVRDGVPAIGPAEVLLPVAAAAAFLLAWRRAMTRAPAVPVGEALATTHP